MRLRLIVLLVLIGLAGVHAAPAAANHEIVIGMQCDRTGATQIVGTILCPGKHDYIALVNSKGGVEGHKIKALEVDHEYKVPPGVESYERHKKEGAVSIDVYGTPHIYALAAKLTARQSPFSATACECCAKCCDECAVACEKFKDDKHMVDCAKSCRDCAKACRAMIEHLKH